VVGGVLGQQLRANNEIAPACQKLLLVQALD
jgi:hypothetical protein